MSALSILWDDDLVVQICARLCGKGAPGRNDAWSQYCIVAGDLCDFV